MNRRSPVPETGGIPGFPTHRNHLTSTNQKKSTRRELNPHLRRGIAVRCRYITGAQGRTELSKIITRVLRAPGGNRTLVSALRVQHRGRWTTSAFVFNLVPSVGPEGLEPSLSRLRAGRAAANTLIPSVVSASFSARGLGAEGVEPSSRSYKEHALTLELRAVVCVFVVSGAEGSRTLTVPLKRRERYRYATTPNLLESDVYVSRCVRRAC